MPLLLMCLFFWIRPVLASPPDLDHGWDKQARLQVADPLSLDLAMTAAGLEPGDTSVVYGRTLWRASGNGLVLPRITIGWHELSGPAVIPDLQSPRNGSRRFCMPVAGHDPVPGGRVLRLYRSPRSNVDPLDPVTAQAALVLGTGPDGEVLLGSLRPGEQIQITEAIPIRGGQPQEYLRIERDGKSLSIIRNGDGARVCYDDAG
jgi:hypothetical protein